jgi:hypothetical protein
MLRSDSGGSQMVPDNAQTCYVIIGSSAAKTWNVMWLIMAHGATF